MDYVINCWIKKFKSFYWIFNKALIQLIQKRSFGCILFELIELKKAYDQESIYEIMNAIMKGPVPVINSNDEDFNFILYR